MQVESTSPPPKDGAGVEADIWVQKIDKMVQYWVCGINQQWSAMEMSFQYPLFKKVSLQDGIWKSKGAAVNKEWRKRRKLQGEYVVTTIY
jgi:hypothetical protein